MRKTVLFLFVIIFSTQAHSQDLKSVCGDINALNSKILEGQVDKPVAAAKFKALISQLAKAQTTVNLSLIFPLKGYGLNAIGGTKGNGYYAKGYSYFDGNKHTAHPAHDIFIKDMNQDCLDDRTNKSVPVVAVEDGIVIACADQWEADSKLRGGKYIWLFHPNLNMLSYYAHNNRINVHPGDEVKQGQQIAEVGRTGLNAYKQRSPTHLHFGTYKLKDGLPVAFNPYQLLLNAKRL